MEKRRSPLVSSPPRRGGDFQGIGVYRPMTFLVVSVQRERIGSRAAKHRLDEPARLSLSMVASLQSLPPFHPAVHFSSAVLNFQFARLAGGTIPFIRRYSTI